MSIELPGAVAPEDLLCRYGASKLMCRGPKRKLDDPYVAFLGGSETFGKFVEHPFVAQVEAAVGTNCINLGSANSGLDAYVQDPDILDICSEAKVVVIQVMGAQNLSNRYYRVHPRRNDRFLTASPLLQTIYRTVDFTEIHFNKHLLSVLNTVSSERFQIVLEELRQAWLGRMRLLLGALDRKPVLLWLRYPEIEPSVLGPEPLLIKRAMLDDLRDEIAQVIEIDVECSGDLGELEKMKFAPMQEPAAAHMIGPDMHRNVAEQVAEILRGIL